MRVKAEAAQRGRTCSADFLAANSTVQALFSASRSKETTWPNVCVTSGEGQLGELSDLKLAGRRRSDTTG